MSGVVTSNSDLCVVGVEELEAKIVDMEEKMVKQQKVLDQEKVKKVEAINKLADVSVTIHKHTHVHTFKCSHTRT